MCYHPHFCGVFFFLYPFDLIVPFSTHAIFQYITKELESFELIPYVSKHEIGVLSFVSLII